MSLEDFSLVLKHVAQRKNIKYNYEYYLRFIVFRVVFFNISYEFLGNTF